MQKNTRLGMARLTQQARSPRTPHAPHAVATGLPAQISVISCSYRHAFYGTFGGGARRRSAVLLARDSHT